MEVKLQMDRRVLGQSALQLVQRIMNLRHSCCRDPVRSDSGQAALHARHAVIMTGDWTDRDAAITAYLEAHHRDGVPLYVYYPPGHAAPIVLPQILTPSVVRRVLRDDVG
jgi:hypothetical protein